MCHEAAHQAVPSRCGLLLAAAATAALIRHMTGWVFDESVKTPLGLPVSCIRVPELESWLYFQLCANVHCGRQQVMAQGNGPLPSQWDICIKFLALNFGLVQSWLQMEALLVCLFACQIK